MLRGARAVTTVGLAALAAGLAGGLALAFGRGGRPRRGRPDRVPLLTVETILEELLARTGASRVTLRQDVPGDYAFPVTHEALAPGAGSLRHERTVDLRTQPVVRRLAQGEQVVQEDSRAAFDDAAYQRMLEAYGGLAAQIVTPVFVDGALTAIVSLHQLGEPRSWRTEDAELCATAAERIRTLL